MFFPAMAGDQRTTLRVPLLQCVLSPCLPLEIPSVALMIEPCSQLMKAFVILLPLMGLTWIIGLFAVSAHPATLIFQIIFIILNSLQVDMCVCTCVCCVHVLVRVCVRVCMFACL